MPSYRRTSILIAAALLILAIAAVPAMAVAPAAGSKSDVAPILKSPQPPRPVVEGCSASAIDDCANAYVITSLPFSDPRDTTCATDEPGEPQSTCTLAANTIWYTYTPAGDELVTVSLVASDFDTTLMIWEGTCGSFSPVACNDDFSGLQSQATFLASGGTTYYFQVAGFDGETGNAQVDVTAIELPCPTFDVSTSFTGATSQSGRIFRDGVPSTCANKPYPGPFNVGTIYNYETDTYPNPTPDAACVQINFDPNSGANACGTNAHMSAYAGSYDPLNQGANFLGDVGSSDTLPFQVTIAGNTDLVLVTTNTSSQAICDYSYQVVGVPCIQQGPTAMEIPALGHRNLLILAGLLATAGLLLLLRRRG